MKENLGTQIIKRAEEKIQKAETGQERADRLAQERSQGKAPEKPEEIRDEKYWLKEQEEAERRQYEIDNQRKFFLDLKQKLRKGLISPDEVIEWEKSSDFTPKDLEEIAYDSHKWKLWVERDRLSSELREMRQQMERNKVRDRVVNELLAERELKEKAKSLTDKEELELEKRLQEKGF